MIVGALVLFVAEIAAFVLVGERIGFAWAVLLLIGVSALGPFLVRRVGLGVLERTRVRLARGEVPTREVLDGVVLLAGGVLICIPGFIGDALGLLLLVGPVRHLLILIGGRRVARRVQVMSPARWRVIDARSRPAGPDLPAEPDRPVPPMIDRGDDPGK